MSDWWWLILYGIVAAGFGLFVSSADAAATTADRAKCFVVAAVLFPVLLVFILFNNAFRLGPPK